MMPAKLKHAFVLLSLVFLFDRVARAQEENGAIKSNPGALENTAPCVKQSPKSSYKLGIDSIAWKRARKVAQWRRRRIIFNNDGDDIWSPPPKTPQEFLKSRTLALLDSQVDSIFYCSGRTTTIWHDTKVGNVANMGSAKRFIDDFECDCLQIQVEFCQKNGIEIFWSMRMNDIHDSYRQVPALASEQMANDLFSEFKQQHPDYLMGKAGDSGKYPKESVKILWSALNYGLPEVREHLYQIIQEVCQRYDVDGIELDFERSPIFFTPTLDMLPVEQQHLDAMTDLVRRIRQMTAEQGLMRGRPILVATRVPLTVERSTFLGLDVDRWLREDLIDIIINGEGYSPMAMPCQEMIELGHKHDVPVYPCITNDAMYEGGFWGTGKGPDLLNLSSIEAWRGAASNIWSSGADGVYLFNCFDPTSPIWRELGSRRTLAGLDKVFAVDYLDIKSTLGEAKAALPTTGFLPMTMDKVGAFNINLPVGEEIDSEKLAELKLWLHMSRGVEVDSIVVKLNGEILSSTARNKNWLGFSLTADRIRTGKNKVNVALSMQKQISETPVLLDGLQLAVRYK